MHLRGDMVPVSIDGNLHETHCFELLEGIDTLRCLALATVDEPLSPSDMDLEESDNFVKYEVSSCGQINSKLHSKLPYTNT